MRIEIVKQADGSGVLRCTRPDGSVTWQKQRRHASHFAHHDLTHYAVETVRGYQRGFFGLIAEGWDVADTTGKGARGPIPVEAGEVEHIVGLLDTERGAGHVWPVEQFNQYASRPFNDVEVQRIRELRKALFRQWSETPAGNSLELTFECPAMRSA